MPCDLASARSSASTPHQAVADELHAPVGARQRVEDVAVEDEGAPHLARRAQRVVQRGVVVGAQVAAQPDQRGSSGLGIRVSQTRGVPPGLENEAWPAARIDLTNQFLIAMPGMGDDTFAGTVVYLCEHNERGALGLVINKPIDIKLKNLFEKVELHARPRRPGRAAGVLRRPGADRARLRAAREAGRGDGHYNSTLSIPGGLEMTTSKDVLEALSNGAGPRKLLVTLGYSGWGAGQLEDEIGRNGWLTVDADPAHLRHPGRAALRPRAVAAGHRPAHAQPGGGARMSPPGARARRWRRPWPSTSALRRVGVASGNTLLRQARPLKTLPPRATQRFDRHRQADRRVAARRAGGRRAAPPRRRGARQYAPRAALRAPAARPLRAAGARGRRALHHHRGPGAARATSTRRRRR
jgi:putative transcriptional regulator